MAVKSPPQPYDQRLLTLVRKRFLFTSCPSWITNIRVRTGRSVRDGASRRSRSRPAAGC